MKPEHHIATKEFTLLMALLMSIVAISIDALLPALGVIGDELGIENANHVQLVIVCIFLGMSVGQLIAGPLSDAKGRKPILYGGILLYLVGSVICYTAQDFDTLLLGRIIQGFGVSGPYVTAVSVVRDKFAGAQMAKVMSLVMMIFIMVPALAPSLGQAVLHFAGWRAIFLMYLGYSVAIGLWIMLRLEETLPMERRIPMKVHAFWLGLKIVLKNRTTILYTLAMGLCFGCLIGYLGASQQIFQNQFGVGEKFPLYFGGLALMLGIASLINSKIVAKFGMRPICQVTMATMAIISILFVGMHLAVGSVTLIVFVGYLAILFFSFGLMFGNLNAVAMEPMGAVAGMASAITGAISSVISLSLGTVIGQAYNNTVLPVALGFAVLTTLGTLLLRIEYLHYRKHPFAATNASPSASFH